MAISILHALSSNKHQMSSDQFQTLTEWITSLKKSHWMRWNNPKKKEKKERDGGANGCGRHGNHREQWTGSQCWASHRCLFTDWLKQTRKWSEAHTHTHAHWPPLPHNSTVCSNKESRKKKKGRRWRGRRSVCSVAMVTTACYNGCKLCPWHAHARTHAHTGQNDDHVYWLTVVSEWMAFEWASSHTHTHTHSKRKRVCRPTSEITEQQNLNSIMGYDCCRDNRS